MPSAEVEIEEEKHVCGSTVGRLVATTFSFASVFRVRGTSNGTYSRNGSAYLVWTTGVSPGLGEAVICVWMVFYAWRVHETHQRGEDSLLGASL